MSVGKDESASVLVRSLGFRRLAFADALKETCMSAFGFSREQVYGEGKMKPDPYWGASPGHFLQIVGTELFRNHIDLDFWVKRAMRRIDAEPDDNWALVDLRFENEARAVLDRGGFVVRIDRPLAPGDPERSALHSSETALDSFQSWSAVIVNDGTLEDLRARVLRLYTMLSLRSALRSDASRSHHPCS